MKLFKIESGHIEKDKGSDNILNEFEKIKLSELGNLISKTIADETTKSNVLPYIKSAVQSNEKICALTGDHSTTFVTIKSIAECNLNVGLILFDAHPDCREVVDEDEDWIRKLVNKKIVRPENIIMIGIRATTPEEMAFLKANRIKYFPMKYLQDNSLNEFCDTVMENAVRWQAVYISVDMDVIDPAFAPGVETSEVGGLTPREIIYFMQRLRNIRNVKMLDVAEFMPSKDLNEITAKLGAKIISEFM